MKYVIFFLLIPVILVCAQDIGVEQERRTEIIEDTKRVVVSGVGSDRDAAIKQGLRSAVEQAIGVFLKSETVVENYQLLSDKILTHSRGYVQSFDIVKEERRNGSYYLTLSAVVTVKELENTLVELRLHTREVEGESLFGKAFTQIDSRKSGAALFADLRETLISKAIAVEFAEVEVESVDGDSATVIIPYNLVWNPAYLTDMVDVLEQTCEEVSRTPEDTRMLQDQYKPLWDRGYSQFEIRDQHPRSNETVSYFTKDIYAKALVDGLGSDREACMIYELRLVLRDQEGNELLSKNVRRTTRLVGFSTAETKKGFKISAVWLNKYVSRDWQRKRNYTYATIRMHVDRLKDVRSVTGTLQF